MLVLLLATVVGMNGENKSNGAVAFSRIGDSHNNSFQSAGQTTDPTTEAEQAPYLNAWGLDILISNDGFGLGTFYRRQFSENLFGFGSFSISESKEEREVERYDPYTGNNSVPGKLNRFLVLPLMVGVQYRLFSDEILDTFRPYVNGGAGPTMIFASPFTDLSTGQQVEFFKSLGRGKAHYTAGAFVGIGANFGSDKSNVFGVNFRYYFTYLFGEGLPSLFDSAGNIAGHKKDFGGFFITLNVGMAY